MKAAVVGTGYVGATMSVALGLAGHEVVGVDVDRRKVDELNRGTLPFYEEGMEEKLKELRASGRVRFTTDLEAAVRECEVVMIAVGTPMAQDGSADLTAVEAVAGRIGRTLDAYRVIVNKSTVPVGTGERVRAMIEREVTARGVKASFDVVSNPEFLREGRALFDALYPERIVVGAESERARQVMRELYAGVNAPLLLVSVRDAEMIKYASNAFLATKISFVNELARLCERTGTDVSQVAQGMGLDSRIGSQFLGAGIGYGGSCFPKDVEALLMLAKRAGVPLQILEATKDVNEGQAAWFLRRAENVLGGWDGKKICLLGLTFKPGTDDIREAPALRVIPALLAAGAEVAAYDPMGIPAVRRLFAGVRYEESAEAALQGADAVLLLTEWREFLELDWAKVREWVRDPVLFDGRNALDGQVLAGLGYRWYGVGKGDVR